MTGTGVATGTNSSTVDDDGGSGTGGDDSSLIDCNGDIISTVVIGGQEWATVNACNTTYADGTPIAQIIDNLSWGALVTGAWCYVDNDDPA